jgi:hypothetical protein
MDLTQARLDLARALEAAAAVPHEADRFRPARQLLMRSGAATLGIEAAALGIEAAATPELAEIVEHVARAPASPARRVFAVLLVDALAVPGLLSARSSQARLDRAVRALVENALPDVLLRAGYPFAGDVDARRRSLSRLQATIEDHLQPLEPSNPTWLSGRTER